jgi:voltage-gated potassium channel
VTPPADRHRREPPLPPAQPPAPRHGGWREAAHHVIFEADTPAGRVFDLALMAVILASVAAVMLDSVPAIHAAWGPWLYAAEWVFTALFTVEYALRLATVARPLRYARSFFGIVDLLAVLPTYLSVLLPGTQALLVVRALRLLRVFRVLKLVRYFNEARVLLAAVRAALPKILVFLYTELALIVIIAALVYLIEGPENGFTSIPKAMYWTVVTLTTVGYGDMVPHTATGKVLASITMLLGYGIIAVPTGIVTVEMGRARRRRETPARACPACERGGHARDAAFCRFCGTMLGND